MLVALRMVQGAGASLLNPVAVSIIRHAFPDRRERAKAVGVWSGVAGISMAAGPVIGGMLVDGLGWRSVFWVNGPVGVLALVAASVFVAESRAAQARRLDLPGQALVVCALGLTTYALIDGPAGGWRGPLVLVAVLAAAAWVGLALVERRVPQPLIDPQVFRRAAVFGPIVIALFAAAVFNGSLFVGVVYLQQVLGKSALAASLILMPGTAAIALASLASGAMAGRWGLRLPLVVGGALLVGGSMVLTCPTPTVPPAVVLVGGVLFGLGLSMAGAVLYRENAARHPLVFLHTITVPEALRSLMRYIPAHFQTMSYAFTWQYVAAMVSIYGRETDEPATELDEPGSVADVIERSVETGDEHAFKLTAACVREYGRHKNPIYLAVADDWNKKMLRARGWDHQRMRIAVWMSLDSCTSFATCVVHQ
ncbi:putative MFS family arabinose efflux permease [Actinocrispum wychmicini]|uniref:Putative MFS family arabinose efflux permease n=1 Tax=Actinocrispum wychmicini TaxID=1213861 RepID=A0A4R2JK24_9PSEU|nr:putative MFS family arabinose efflux permease [Actinocrispum wychmicini]